MQQELPLRIVVLDPVPGVALCVQRGRDELLPPTRATAAAATFDFAIRVELNGDRLRILGPFAQGPPNGRFVYVNSGKRAGQADSCWDRRAKVPLAGVTAALVKKALAAPGSVIEAQIAGTGRDGGPSCATVPLAREWRVVR